MARWTTPWVLATLALGGCDGDEGQSPGVAAPIQWVRGEDPDPAPDRVGAAPEAGAGAQALEPHQAELLRSWYEALGDRRPSETFGELVVRAAQVHLGKPYLNRPPAPEIEHLRIELDHFECVSLVESSIAAARCLWIDDPSEACFRGEIQRFRYRDGIIDGYPSRLHYFSDWIADNARRGRLEVLTDALGGVAVTRPFHFMTSHPARYPSMNTDAIRAAIRQREVQLSELPISVIARDRVQEAQRDLQSGDLVAIVGSKPGILVVHAGLVARGADGIPRLLHASSHARRVLLGPAVAQYIRRKPERQGILVARPTAPERFALSSKP